MSELDSSGDMGVMGWFPSPWEIIKWLGKKIKDIANKVGQTIKKWATEVCRVAGKSKIQDVDEQETKTT